MTRTKSNVAAAGRGDDIPLAPPVMPLHCEAALRFSSSFHDTTYTRTGGFCPGANPEFQRVARQNPPVLWLTESACSCPEQPLSATHGRQRYNTLDFARKVVCHETAGFIGFFLPRRTLPSIGCLPPRQRVPFGIPDAFWNAYPQRKNELWAFIAKRTLGSIICYGDLQRVCRNQMTDILRRRKDTPSAALSCFDTVLTSAVPDGRGRWQRLP